MRNNGAQTATEYLVITTVVIVIAVLLVTILGGIPSLGSGSTQKVDLLEFQNRPVGLKTFAYQPNWSKFEIQNNEQGAIEINSLWVDQKPCASDTFFPFLLLTGKSKVITCYNIKGVDPSFTEFVVEYVNKKTSATQNSAGLFESEFKGTTTTDCWGTQTEPGVYDICTCDDLNRIRDNATTRGYDYALRYNIDFLSPSCSAYRSGTGWEPIGNCVGSCSFGDDEVSFNGTFDGYNFTISNLYLADDTGSYSGLFGSIFQAIGNHGDISRLGVVNVDLTTTTAGGIAGIVGYSREGTLYQTYTSGRISGLQYVGGISGYGGYTNITESFSLATVRGIVQVGGVTGANNFGSTTKSYFIGSVIGGSQAGGIAGSATNAPITSSYSLGTVSGTSNIGGIIGAGTGASVSDSFTESIITCSSTYCGGLVGNPSSVSVLGTNTWINHSSGSPGFCLGSSSLAPAGASTANCTALSE